MSQGNVVCRRLEGKVALVTASTAGIGLGIARRLAQEGAAVVISSRKQSNVDEAVENLQQEGLQVSGIACHVGDDQQLQKLVDYVVQKHGGLDVLISNAAVNPTSGPIIDTDISAIDKILSINGKHMLACYTTSYPTHRRGFVLIPVRSAVVLAQKAVPHMRKPGSIIFVSSYTAYNPTAPIAMYAVSKTALLGLTKALAEELGPDGIRVNCIAPGIVPTKFASALVASDELKVGRKEEPRVSRANNPKYS